MTEVSLIAITIFCELKLTRERQLRKTLLSSCGAKCSYSLQILKFAGKKKSNLH